MKGKYFFILGVLITISGCTSPEAIMKNLESHKPKSDSVRSLQTCPEIPTF